MAVTASRNVSVSRGCKSCVCMCVPQNHQCDAKNILHYFTGKSIGRGNIKDVSIPLKAVDARWLNVAFVVYFNPRLLLFHMLLKSEEKATLK